MCFASHSVSNMLRRVTAQHALLQLQDISADCSDGEYSKLHFSRLEDEALTNDAQAELDSSGKNQTSIVLANTMTAIYRIKCR